MKGIILLLFLVLFSGIVLAAGEMKTLDFSNSTYMLVQIGSRDGVRFDWGGAEHKIVIGNMNRAEQRVELTAFIEGASTPNYAALTSKTSIVYDFERDDVKDLQLSLVKFVDDQTVILLFERLSEPQESPAEEGRLGSRITGFFSKWPFYSASYNIGLLVVVILIIIILLGSSRFMRRKYRRMKRSMRMG
ncbi:MAG: hypothetical protein V1645_02950 [archaeon]